MRLAIVTEYYRPTVGGIQEHVFHFAREARKRGHEVTVVTSGGDIQRPGMEPGVLRLGRSVPIDANGSVARMTTGTGVGRHLREWLVSSRFDRVHVHAPLTPVLPVLAARATSLPLAGTFHTHFHGSPLLRLTRRLAQQLVDRIDLPIAVSGACIRSIATYVRVNPCIIPNGVDTACWAAGRPIPQLREGRPTVLFVGRLEPRSGLDLLLDAWPYLPASANDPLLLVVGDGPERDRFRRQASEQHIAARFLGTRHADRPDIFATADLLVCPTRIASFGVTLLEGMAAGLPVLAADIEGHREVLTHEAEGLLVDMNAPRELAATMAALLADGAWRRRLGMAGLRTAATYDWSHVTDRVLSLYAGSVSVA